MRNSTTSNFKQRKLWLEEIADGKIKPTKEQQPSLVSLREFCKLSVKSRFEKIAYNTLKSAALQKQNNQTRSSSIDGWDDLKESLTQARLISNPAATPTPKETLPPAKDVQARTLLEAHICSMAYLELFSFLSSLLSYKPELPDAYRALIEHQLAITSAKFKLIISHTDQFSSDRAKLHAIVPGANDEH